MGKGETPIGDYITPIVFCVDKNYGVYLPVVLHSILVNSNAAAHYHIIILDSGADAASIENARVVIRARENFSLQIENIEEWFKRHKESFKEIGYLSKAMYGRLLIPEICAGYKKAIYAEVDCVFNRDIAELFDLNLEGNYIAAVTDPLTEAARKITPETADYIANTLKLNEAESYVFSGFLVFNIYAWLKEHLAEKCITFLRNNDTVFPDQDAINAVCKERITYLPQVWCVTILADLVEERYKGIPVDKYPRQYALLEEWRAAYKTASENVIHYNGPDKPWMPQSDNPLNKYWQELAPPEILAVAKQRAKEAETRKYSTASGKEVIQVYKFLGVPLMKVKTRNGVKKYLAFNSICLAKCAYHSDRREFTLLGLLHFDRKNNHHIN